MFFGAILTSGFSAGWSIVKLILITVLVLVLAFYSTRLIAKYQNNTWSAKNNIQFIESYRVGGNKMVAIAKIGEKYFALGIGKEEIHVIAELKKASRSECGCHSRKDTEDELQRSSGEHEGKRKRR